jgi:hypothetical protein
MDRRAKKLEKKRKSRDQAKKKASALAARKPGSLELLARSAAREKFGPCFVSTLWDDLETPALVSVIMTRKLPSGQLLPGTALIDRTCLGVKDAFLREPMLPRDLAEFVDHVGFAHGGMLPCEPLVAQSIVFHAIDYARALGFEPHPDFPATLFGPRPAELLNTPWHAPERPIYVSGPRDNVNAITTQLAKTAGTGGFEYVDPLALLETDDDDDQSDDEDADDAEDEDGVLVHSPLERTVARDAATLRILIYRGSTDAGWLLEIEDHLGGSTVWNEPFESDRAALDAAMLAIEEDGIESFVVPSAAGT